MKSDVGRPARGVVRVQKQWRRRWSTCGRGGVSLGRSVAPETQAAGEGAGGHLRVEWDPQAPAVVQWSSGRGLWKPAAISTLEMVAGSRTRRGKPLTSPVSEVSAEWSRGGGASQGEPGFKPNPREKERARTEFSGGSGRSPATWLLGEDHQKAERDFFFFLRERKVACCPLRLFLK